MEGQRWDVFNFKISLTLDFKLQVKVMNFTIYSGVTFLFAMSASAEMTPWETHIT